MMYTLKEEKLIELLTHQSLSMSHQLDHLERVVDYGRWLCQQYGGSVEVVVPAALLHDLGRSHLQARGKESAVLGAALAEPLLTQAGYDAHQRQLIMQVISEHDQPHFHSQVLESRVLKDADFLDGFGARGVWRSLLYTGETQGSLDEALDRLTRKARERIAGLEFLESRRLAWKLHRLTEFMVSELRQAQSLSNVSYSGKLIFLEGISGAGKDTQAQLLRSALTAQGKTARIMNHPTAFLKSLWQAWRAETTELGTEGFLILADRFRKVKEEMMPALQAGEVVISSRSSIDIQVYQHNQSISDELYRLIFSFEPVPDLVIYLDLDVAEAYQRTQQRVASGQDQQGFFTSQQETQKVRFADVLPWYPHVVTLDASQSKEEVHRQIWSAVEKMEENLL